MRSISALAVLVLMACTRPPSERHVDEEPERTAPAATTSSPLDPQVVARIIATPRGVQWFGVYLGKRKIGHGSLSLRPSRGTEPTGSVTVESTMNIAIADASGPSSSLELIEQSFYEREPPYRLMGSFHVESSPDGRVETRATRRGRWLEVRARHGDNAPRGRTVAASGETFASAALAFVEPADLEAGQLFEHRELDTEAWLDRAVGVRVVSNEKRRIAGVETSVVTLRSDASATSATETVLVDGGRTLRIDVGGFSFRAEPHDVARSDIVGFDHEAAAVRVEKRLGDPGRVDSLALALRSGSGFVVPAFANQRVSVVDGTQRIELTRGPVGVVSAAERERYVGATAAIDSDHPAIASAARRVTRNASSDAEKLRMLSAWVFRELEKDVATDIPTASSVLERKRGDCTEHALLLVALARSLGIPAREVSGLTYTGDDNQRFGWHAWAQIAVRGRWQAVDPSWDESLANATHVTLGIEGDNEWIALLGDIDITILDATSTSP